MPLSSQSIYTIFIRLEYMDLGVNIKWQIGEDNIRRSRRNKGNQINWDVII